MSGRPVLVILDEIEELLFWDQPIPRELAAELLVALPEQERRAWFREMARRVVLPPPTVSNGV